MALHTLRRDELRNLRYAQSAFSPPDQSPASLRRRTDGVDRGRAYMSSVRGGFPEAQRILSSCHFGCSSSHCAARRCPRHTQAANPDQPSSASDLNVWQVIGLPHQTENQRKVTSIIGSA